MSQTKIDFGLLRWESIRKGGMVGRSKTYDIGAGRTARILEMAPAWNEKEWCRKEHVGYVLSGTLHVGFRSERSLNVEKGQAFSIPVGTAHKASCKTTTRLFIVDRKPD